MAVKLSECTKLLNIMVVNISGFTVTCSR